MAHKIAPAICIIPARLESTRLERKLCLNETGKSLLQHTYENAKQCLNFHTITIASDSDIILSMASEFHANTIIKTPPAKNGTERCAMALEKMEETETIPLNSETIVVNVQGDCPEVPWQELSRLIHEFQEYPDIVCATLAFACDDEKKANDLSVVKVVTNIQGDAIYFTRRPTPHVPGGKSFLHHVGVYAYRARFLKLLQELPPSFEEDRENLEQMRILACGYRIRVRTMHKAVEDVNTREDYDRFVERCR